MGHESEQTPGESEEWKPGVLQSMGSQAGRHNLVPEPQQHAVFPELFIEETV